MTTRTTKDPPPPGKEKRGTSPSTLLGPRTPTVTAQHSSRPNGPNPPKKAASPSRPNISSSTSSEKSVPNYLKPTRSSGPEASKQLGKKPNGSKSEPLQKPAILRRRSFDKPPSVSQSLRSRISPNPALRSSSSFSGRTVSPPRRVPAKITKTPGKQPTMNARRVSSAGKGYKEGKKPKTAVDISPAGKGKVVILPKQVKNVHAPDIPKLETQSRDICDENVDKKRDEDSFAENKELASEPEQSEGEITSEEDIAKISDSVVEDQEPEKDEQVDGDGEDRDAKITTFEHQGALGIEKTEGKSELDEDENSVISEDLHVNDQEPLSTEQTEGEIECSEVETPTLETLEKGDACSNVSDDTKQEELELIKDDNISSDVTNAEESVRSNESEEVEDNKDNEVGNDGGEGWEISREREECVEKKEEAVSVQMAHGKREIAVSNDVIEETASKLREQRKNKVKALAGAFETVISLQEPK